MSSGRNTSMRSSIERWPSGSSGISTAKRPSGWCSKNESASTRACPRKRRDATVQAMKSSERAIAKAPRLRGAADGPNRGRNHRAVRGRPPPRRCLRMRVERMVIRVHDRRGRVDAFVAVSLWLLVFAGAASAASVARVIWAHRGGPYRHGQPRYPENTMPAFRASAAAGYVLELDARITRDGELVVMHDATLKRTTVCKGPVARLTAAYITHRCPSDVIGSPKNPLGWRRTAKTTRVPTLDKVLRFARRARASVTIELKDRDRRAARALTLAIRRAHVPLRQVIVQSFRFTNLRRVR